MVTAKAVKLTAKKARDSTSVNHDHGNIYFSLWFDYLSSRELIKYHPLPSNFFELAGKEE